MIQNFQEAEAFLYEQLPIYQRQGKKAYKPDLSRTLDLLALTGHPEKKLKCVHVAGTNGKGTTAHALASICQEAGLHTGLHTSPHLLDLTERTRINGRPMDATFVVAYLNEIALHLATIQPSFFELNVAMGFTYLARQGIDIAVIETGLGGRLDSTNVVQPELSVITHIGWDHMDILGNTLEKIAMEKAGIIKSGIPTVFSGRPQEVIPVFADRCHELGVRLHLPEGSAVWAQQPSLRRGTFLYQGISYLTDVLADYFLLNVPTILKSVEVLMSRGWQLSDAHVHAGLANIQRNTNLRGRWQSLSEQPKIVADVSHNPEGIQHLLNQVKALNRGKLHIVLGTVTDKPLEELWSVLPREACYYFTAASVPRRLPVEELLASALNVGLVGKPYTNVQEAVDAAKADAFPDDFILITGSTYIVAEYLSFLK